MAAAAALDLRDDERERALPPTVVEKRTRRAPERALAAGGGEGGRLGLDTDHSLTPPQVRLLQLYLRDDLGQRLDERGPARARQLKKRVVVAVRQDPPVPRHRGLPRRARRCAARARSWAGCVCPGRKRRRREATRTRRAPRSPVIIPSPFTVGLDAFALVETDGARRRGHGARRAHPSSSHRPSLSPPQEERPGRRA